MIDVRARAPKLARASTLASARAAELEPRINCSCSCMQQRPDLSARGFNEITPWPLSVAGGHSGKNAPACKGNGAGRRKGAHRGARRVALCAARPIPFRAIPAPAESAPGRKVAVAKIFSLFLWGDVALSLGRRGRDARSLNYHWPARAWQASKRADRRASEEREARKRF